MNSTFKIVFNRARGAMTVVNEMTKSHQTGRKAAVAVAVAGALAFSAGVHAADPVYVEGAGKDITVTKAHITPNVGNRVVGGWNKWSDTAQQAALNNTVTVEGGEWQLVIGGHYTSKENEVDHSAVQNTHVVINGGTITKSVAGGLASGHKTHSFVTEANLSVIAKDKALVVKDSIFAGGVRRMDSLGGSGGSVKVDHATVRVEGVEVQGGIYGTHAALKGTKSPTNTNNIIEWHYTPLEIAGAVATVLTDMTLVNVTAKESILGKDSTLNVHGKVDLGELKATDVKISLFDAPANTPKVQTFADDAPQTGTQLNLGTLTGTGNSFYFATSDASVNIEKNGNENTPDADKPLIDSITGSGSVNDDVAGDLNELASMITVGDKTGADVLKNTDLKLESGDVFGETTGTINEEGKLEDVKTSVNMNNVRIAEFAMRTPMQIARIESNDLRKRLGDIRSSEGATGVWARYDGGRFSGGEFENKFNKVQVGADTALAAYGSRLGLSFSYTQGDADMSGISADTDAYSLAAYGMWFGEAGQFADVIGRVGTVDTDLATRTYKTNYDQLMLSLSGEFGWRFDLTDTFYAEPSAELTYTRVDGETFKANGNTLGIDDYDSMVGRIGATAGLNCSQGRGGVYARFGVAHEFMGDGRFTAVNAAGTAADPIEVDGKDTWVEYAVGANFNITKQTYVWADLERTSGAEVDEDWRATIGVRHAF